MKRMLSPFVEHSQRADGMADDDAAVAGYSRTDDTSITPFTIRSRRFGRRLLLGLHPAEVMAFLDVVAGALKNAQTRYIEIGTEMQLLEADVQARTMTEVANPRLDMSHKRQCKRRTPTPRAGSRRYEVRRCTRSRLCSTTLKRAHTRPSRPHASAPTQ